MGYGLTRIQFPHGKFAIPNRVARQGLPEDCPRSQGRSQPRRRRQSSAIETLRSTIGPSAPTTPRRLPRIECCSPAKSKRKLRGTTGRRIVREGSLAPLVSPASGVCGGLVRCLIYDVCRIWLSPIVVLRVGFWYPPPHAPSPSPRRTARASDRARIDAALSPFSRSRLPPMYRATPRPAGESRGRQSGPGASRNGRSARPLC